jgi:hypothetical protein
MLEVYLDWILEQAMLLNTGSDIVIFVAHRAEQTKRLIGLSAPIEAKVTIQLLNNTVDFVKLAMKLILTRNCIAEFCKINQYQYSPSVSIHLLFYRSACNSRGQRTHLGRTNM